MADNGNRGPNDSFRRSGRRRREPPIIDAAATEVRPEQAEAATPGSSAPAPFSAEPPRAADETPLDIEPPIETDVPESERPGAPAAERDTPAPDASDEPVLFGSAARRPVTPDATPATTDGTPEATDASPVTLSESPSETAAAEDATPSARTADHEPPGFASAGPTPAGAGEPPRPAEPRNDPPPPASGSNTLAGVFGVAALVLLGIIGWLVYAGGRNGDLAATVADLKTRIATLEARPDAAALQSQIAALDKRVAAAESERTALGKQVSAADADRATLGKQVAALSARIDAAGQPAAGSPGAKPSDAGGQPSAAPALASMAAVAALAAKVDGIDGRLATLSTDQSTTSKAVAALPKPVAPDFGPINAKAAALETAINAVDAKINGSDARFNAFDARINGIEAKVNGFGTTMNGMTARMNDLEAKVGDNAAQIAKTKSDLLGLPKVDLGPLQTATAALDTRLTQVEGQLAAPKDGARVTQARAVGSGDLAKATPIALVGETIERAIATGKPYGSEIDALKTLGADPAAVARLGPAASGGAPSVEALATQWNGVRDAVLATEKPIAPAAGGTFNRFLSSATSIVQVHPVGAVQGADTNALVSQIDAALGQGDVSGALAAWDKLPDAGKAASRAWADASRSRVDALAAASDLVTEAIATLGRPTE